MRLGSCKPRFIARPRRTGNSGACPVTSPLAQLFSFLRDTSLSGLAQARFSPPPLRPLFRDFGVGGATGKRVPRNVYARVHGRLKREGTKYWVWKVARRPRITEGACVLEAVPRGFANGVGAGWKWARGLTHAHWAASAPPPFSVSPPPPPPFRKCSRPGAHQRPPPAAGSAPAGPAPTALRPLLWWWCRVAARVVEVSVPEAGSAESFPGAPARL